MRNLVGPSAAQLSNEGIDTAGSVTIATQYTGAKRAGVPINEPVGGGTMIGVFAPSSLTAEVRHLSAWGKPRANAPGVATVGAAIGFGVVAGALAVRGWAGRTDAAGANASLSATVAPTGGLAVDKLIAVAMRWGGADRTLTLNVLTTGQSAKAGLPGTTLWDPTKEGFYLGSDAGTPFTMAHGATQLYSRILADAEVQAAYGQLKSYFARRGVAI